MPLKYINLFHTALCTYNNFCHKIPPFLHRDLRDRRGGTLLCVYVCMRLFPLLVSTFELTFCTVPSGMGMGQWGSRCLCMI